LASTVQKNAIIRVLVGAVSNLNINLNQNLMKRIYILAIAFATFSVSAFAQQLNNAPALKKQLNTTVVPADEQPRPTTQAVFRDEGDIIWQDGFDDATMWALDTPDGSLDPAVNGWSIGNTNNSWFGVPALATTAPFARFVNGNPTSNPMTTHNGGPFIFTYTGTIPDLTGIPAPHLEFEQTGARFVTIQEVQMSTDGGVTWQTAYSNSVIPPHTQAEASLYANPHTVRTNITNIVNQNPSNIMIRLFWDGAMNGPDMNYIEYVWMVDNLRIVEGLENDMTLVQTDYTFWDPQTAEDYADLRYTIYHNSQVRPLNLWGVTTNNGANTQTDVYMEVTIDGPAGTEVLSSASQNVAPGDTVTFELSYTPSGEPDDAGSYSITYEIIQNEEDANPDDNLGSRSFSVSTSEMARDNRAASGAFTNFTGEFVTGSFYTMTENVTIYGVSVGLDDDSEVGTFFGGQLLDMDLEFLVETTTEQVTNAMLNGTGDEILTEMALEFPYTAIAGESVFPAFYHFGGAEDVVIALAGNCPDFSCYVFATVGDQTCDPCYYNSTPMVRLLFAETVSLENIEPQNGISLGQNVPNPAKDYTIVVFEFEQITKDVTFEIRDISGRLIQSQYMGTLPAGKHTEIIDTQSMNAGIYLYTLYTGNDRQTKRMSVVK